MVFISEGLKQAHIILKTDSSILKGPISIGVTVWECQYITLRFSQKQHLSYMHDNEYTSKIILQNTDTDAYCNDLWQAKRTFEQFQEVNAILI